MSDRRKLIIIWLFAAFAYAVMLAITNPMVIKSEEVRHEVYDAARQHMSGHQCDDGKVKDRVLTNIGIAYGLTDWQVLRVLRHGYKEGWGEMPCDALPWKPWRAEES